MNLILLIVIAIIVALVAYYTFVTQQYNTMAIREMREKLDTLTEVHAGTVTISGRIPRAGVYQLPRRGRLTLLQLLAAAGLQADDAQIRLVRGQGQGALTETLSLRDMRDNPRLAPILEADDQIHVETVQTTEGS